MVFHRLLSRNRAMFLPYVKRIVKNGIDGRSLDFITVEDCKTMLKMPSLAAQMFDQFRSQMDVVAEDEKRICLVCVLVISSQSFFLLPFIHSGAY